MLFFGIIFVALGCAGLFVGGFGTMIGAAAIWPTSALIFLSGIVLIAASRIVDAIGRQKQASSSSSGHAAEPPLVKYPAQFRG